MRLGRLLGFKQHLFPALLLLCAIFCTHTASAQTITNLGWDNGTGTISESQPHTLGGDYIFQINPQTAAHGVWRTLLTVNTGEANLYLVKANPAVPVTSPTVSSITAGSDAILVDQSKFAEGEAWYIRVNATPGATWSITSGDIPVVDWGAVDGTEDTSVVTFGPEGMVWIKAQVNAATVEAWGIRQLDATGTQPPTAAFDMYASRGRAPLVLGSTSVFDQKETDYDQMLVFTETPDAPYYLAVQGSEGSSLTLKGFQHTILTPPSPFNFSVAGQTNSNGFRFVTYKVTVPASGLGWQVKMTPALGDLADVCVRYGRVATRTDNDAYSEYAERADTTVVPVPTPIIDNVVVVPPDLTDGVSYITVYSTKDSSFTFDLQSGDPDVTPVSFINDPNATSDGTASLLTLKNDTHLNLGGWRYFRVDNIGYQLGFLGWELLLNTQVAGTELAVRRSAIPSYGKYRAKGTSSTRSDLADMSSITGVLQDPTHEADIWYIGVYNPTLALGAFDLTTRAPTRTDLSFNGGSSVVTDQSVKLMQFFKVVVPADALGWDVRLSGIATGTGKGKPRMVIRRDGLPDDISAEDNISGKNVWDSGKHWSVDGDYTDDSAADGTNMTGLSFTAGMGAPLEPGTYYIGVGSTDQTGTISYTITSKGIGIGNDANAQPWQMQVTDVAFNGSASATLPAGQAAIYRIVVPANEPGWVVKLEPTAGHEAMMAIRKGAIPNIDAKASNAVDSTTAFEGTAREKTGAEYFYKFATRNTVTSTDEQFLQAGTYYIVVESEGQGAASDVKWGAGDATFTLTSMPMPFADVTADLLNDGETKSWLAQTLQYGEMKLYRVRVASGVDALAAMEAQLKNTTGKPVMLIEKAGAGMYRFPLEKNDTELAYSKTSNSGYERDFYHNALIPVPDPVDDYWILVGNLSQNDPVQAATYDLEVIGTGTPNLSFNGGTASVTSQLANTFRWFRVDVPADALGWDIRLDAVPTGIDPQMVICRDIKPTAFDATGACSGTVQLASATTWASGAQVVVPKEYTDDNDVNSVDITGRYFTAGMNAPLQPGTYYIGVRNPTDETDPVNKPRLEYTIRSRGIGVGNDSNGIAWAIPVTPLAFAGGTGSDLLDPLDMAVYQVDVPAGMHSWEMKMTPAVGEAMIAIGYGHLPNIAATEIANSNSVAGTVREKMGKEYFYKFPTTVDGTILSGTYYVVVVSEGQNPPDHDQLGTGQSSFDIVSNGELTYQTLPTAYDNDTSGYGWTNETVDYGQVKLYRVTVLPGTTSFCTWAQGVGGASLVRNVTTTTGALAFGGDPSGASLYFPYAKNIEGGLVGGYQEPNVSVVIDNPTIGDYWLTVGQDSEGRDEPYNSSVATYDIGLGCTPITEMAFNGGSADLFNGPNTWEWRWIEVPANAKGWDLRLLNPTGGNAASPKMYIRRGQKPVTTGGTINANSSSWPMGDQWAVGTDYTGGDADGSSVLASGRFFTAGVGTPLEPGIYYVGIYNSGTASTSYTLYSRGIGEVGDKDAYGRDWLLPIHEIDFTGAGNTDMRTIGGIYTSYPETGGTSIEAVEGRDIAVYRVKNVPTSVPAWEMQLTPNAGNEAMLAVRRGNIPTGDAGTTAAGIACKAEGNGTRQGTAREQYFTEYYYQYGCRDAIAGIDNQFIKEGDYYAVVVGEGQNPTNLITLGTGTTTYTLSSLGSKPFADAKDTPVDTASPATWTGQTLKHGQQNLYRVRVGAQTGSDPVAIEVKLSNITGKPAVMVERASNGVYRLPNDKSGELAYDSAEDGGYERDFYDPKIITIGSAQNSDYWLSVGAQQENNNTQPTAGYDIQVSRLAIQELAFDGGSSTLAGPALVANQIRYYKVVVPAEVDGSPLLGWKVTTDIASGSVAMRFNKGALPPAVAGTPPAVTHNEGILTVPFLTPGTWYVEVKATADNTAYTITSRPTRAERTWTMPTTAAEFTHPGLSAPDFGNSGVAANGSVILNPGDSSQATDLKAGQMHFYKVVVPANNAGLLRTQLIGYGTGNPQLYIRRDAPPTLDHDISGVFGSQKTTFERSDVNLTDNSTSDSSYGHWVSLDGRVSQALEAGTWWLGVYAEDKTGDQDLHARYQLIVSAGGVEDTSGVLADAEGYVQDLSPTGTTTYSNQSLLKKSVRYYRLKFPQSSLVQANSTPQSWTVTLSGSTFLGVRIRDTAPAGMRTAVPSDITKDADWQDWKDENELTAVDSHPYLKSSITGCTAFPCKYQASGIYQFNLPPLKPGAEYFLAVYSSEQISELPEVLDDGFTITSTVSSTKLPLDGILDFSSGNVSNATLAAGDSRLYRVDVPADAGQWKHISTHSSNIKVYVQQGTVSPEALTANKAYNDWSSVDGFGNTSTGASFQSVKGANSSLGVSFFNATTVANQSPWFPGRSYYVTVRNTGASSASFSMTMQGKLANDASADADADGLSDVWEIAQFGSIANTPTADTDGDGLNNLKEYQQGTDPMNPDTDGDGINDGTDQMPLDAAESLDSDKDGIGNNADTDDDGDLVADVADNCPLVANSTQADLDTDGIGNACQTAVISFESGMPTGWLAGTGPSWQVTNLEFSHLQNSLRSAPIGDALTSDITWKESFAGGTLVFALKTSSELNKDKFTLSVDGVNVPAVMKSGTFGWADITVNIAPGVHTLVWKYTKDATLAAGADAVWIDNLRYVQGEDAGDRDGDGMLDIDDTDDDNDGVLDADDLFPKDAQESADADMDGIGNVGDPDDDNDGVLDAVDAFPRNTSASADTDGDGKPDSCIGACAGLVLDLDDDGDGALDTVDLYPLNPAEKADADADGTGDNADPDDDNDGVSDVVDGMPLNPLEWADSDKDGLGDNADPDDDNDGVLDVNEAGAPDNSIGAGGVVSTASGTYGSQSRFVLAQPDGKVVQAGETCMAEDVAGDCIDRNFMVVRYNSDGSLDTTFDSDGIAVTSVGTGDNSLNAIALLANGKYLAAGSSCLAVDGSNNCLRHAFTLIRYNSDGSVDTTFDTDGIVVTPIGAGDSVAYAMAMQTDGKVILAGSSEFGAVPVVAVVRYNSDGSLDNTFAGDGILTTIAGARDSVAYAAAVQADGKVVVTGGSCRALDTSGNCVDYDQIAIRYQANGDLDGGFGGHGMVSTAVGNGDNWGHSLAIQPDGKLMIAGNACVTTPSSGCVGYVGAFVKLNTNGSRDIKFDLDGIRMTALPMHPEAQNAMVLQLDGKLVLAGRVKNGAGNDVVVGRFLSTGLPDLTFGSGGGKSLLLAAGDQDAVAIAQQRNGAYVVGGWTGDPDAFFLTRFAYKNADGDTVLDTTDNCATVSNLTQIDTDADGYGDACDTDDDNDGLSDALEKLKLGNPLKVDTDSDTISDYDEYLAGTKLNAVDSDLDTVRDEVEKVNGTNPLSKDTDGDALADNLEITKGTNALLADTDGDGLTDGAEITKKTNPLIADTDGDGFADGVDAFPTNPAESLDTDKDGIGNNTDLDDDGDTVQDAVEVVNGTNPLLKDTDSDGLADNVEITKGTNPLLADTDGDGLSDGVEVAKLSNPNLPDTDADGYLDGVDTSLLVKDSDGDGLSDANEVLKATGINNPDTDSDGVNDGTEVLKGTNPIVADTDADGRTDGQELAANTNPKLADSDADGLNDGQEFTLGTKPLAKDTDMDGVADGVEITAGTNPLNADTDGDGVSDGVEVVRKTNALLVDTDGDGVDDSLDTFPTNALETLDTDRDKIGNNADLDDDGDTVPDTLEATRGTNPLLKDTDGDGLADNLEATRLTNPLDTDTDNDGLSDGMEIAKRTNPLKPDTDGDGILDGVDAFPTVATANLDTDGDKIANNLDKDDDGDGLTDLVELGLGTNPLLKDTDGDGIPDKQDLAPTVVDDTDGDGDNNLVDTDDDGDGWLDGVDEFPLDNVLLRQRGGDSANDNLGQAIAMADVNGDGTVDMIAAAPLDDPLNPSTGVAMLDAGSVYVWSGANGSLLYQFKGDSAGDKLGTALTTGDVNNDGNADIIASAPFDDPLNPATNAAMADAGSVFIWSGANGSLLRKISGNTGDMAGMALATLQLDLDGYADVAVGMPKDDPFKPGTTTVLTDAGTVMVYSGADGSSLWQGQGVLAVDNYGSSLAGLGDLDGDGYDELAVGSPNADPVKPGATTLLLGAGTVYVYSGVDGSLLYHLNGNAAGDNFGFALAATGDIDGDTVNELLVGAPKDDVLLPGTVTNLVDAGSAYVYSGADGTLVVQHSSWKAGDKLGTSVAGVGDVDGDGYDDYAIGSPGYDLNNVSPLDVGTVNILSGLELDVLWYYDGATAADACGNAVAGGGDMNGDGRDDVLVGCALRDSIGKINAGSVQVIAVP